MGRKRCENCGAPNEVSPDVAEASQRCSYCGALLSKATIMHGLQPTPASKRVLGVVLGVGTAVMVVGVALVALLGGRDHEPAARIVPPPSSPPVRPPPPVVMPTTPPVPTPPPPPREPTVHDQIRDFFTKGGEGRLCIEGNLARFGPFAGTVSFTVHPEGRVSPARVAMQPDSPKVTRCLQRAFARGPVYRGRSVGAVYHFSGGRSADGLQFRDGVELKGSAE